MSSDRRLIVLLCASMFANGFSIGAFPPLLPELAAGGGLSDSELGSVAGAFGFARMVADIPVGLVVRGSLRRGFMLAPIPLLAGALCLGAGEPLAVLVLGRALMGVGHSLAMMVALTAILRHRPHGRLSASLNAYEFCAILGMLGGINLVGALPARLGWNLAYLIASSPLLLGVALLYAAIGALPGTDDAVPGPSRRPVGLSSRSAVSPLALLVMVAGTTLAMAYSTLDQFVIPIRGSREFGLGRAGISGLFSIAQVCDLIFLLPVGAVSDRYRPTAVLAAMLLTFAAAVACIAFGGFALVRAGCALLGLGMAGWMLPLSLLRQETPVEQIAWRTAVYRVGVDGGIFLGPFVAGLVGTHRVDLLAGLLTAVLVATAAILLWRPRPRGSP